MNSLGYDVQIRHLLEELAKGYIGTQAEILFFYDRVFNCCKIKQRQEYSLISRHINDMITHTHGESAIDCITVNLQTINCHIRKKKYSDGASSLSERRKDKTIHRYIEKLVDCIQLESYRHEILIRNNNTTASLIENKLLERMSNSWNETSKIIDEKADKINANTITTIGLFSAIVFVFFGGVTALGSVFDFLKNVHDMEDLRLLSIVLITIYLVMHNLIFMVIYVISKLIDKPIGRKIRDFYPRTLFVQKSTMTNRYEVCDVHEIVSEHKYKCMAETKRRILNCMRMMRSVILRAFCIIILHHPIFMIPNIIASAILVVLIFNLY